MGKGGFSSITDQVVELLRDGMVSGRWRGTLPGRNRLAGELAVNHKTVEAAMRRLAGEGLLVSQGSGQRRRIVLPTGKPHKAVLRVKILRYEKTDERTDYMVELRHRLQEAGHTAGFASKSLYDLGMDPVRVAGFVNGVGADAWVVCAGSHGVLDWFAAQPVPAFALFGRLTSAPIAGTGPQKAPSMIEAVRRLTGLGHHRIVYLVREERRKPEPGLVERVFLGELRAQGVAVGPYNLPDWEDNPAGFHSCLSSLFRSTPPTALIISGMELFTATQQFLLNHGIRVPQDVSLVSCDPHPNFAWSNPTISHIDFDSDFWVRNAVRWVNAVARGNNRRTRDFNEARFVEGGTVGPASNERQRFGVRKH